MPIAKHRADLAELISIAAIQRKRINQRQRRHHSVFHANHETLTSRLQSYLSKNTSNNNNNNEVRDDELNTIQSENDNVSRIAIASMKFKVFREKYEELFLYISSSMRVFLEYLPIRILRLFIILLAFFNLTVEASREVKIHKLTQAVTILDKTVDIYFITEGIIRMLAIYSQLETLKYLKFGTSLLVFLRKSGISDVIIASCSLSLARDSTGNWIRLLRVLIISSFTLEEVPHLEVLMSGITFGMRSIASTWLLLGVIFLVYASCGMALFQENDPFHFGSIAMSMWSFFEMATLDNWSTVLYLNMYGCAEYSAFGYVQVNSSYDGPIVRHRYGGMILPICSKSEARPVLAILLFVSFTIFCGFILMNLTIAAVAAGIKDRLDELRKEDLEQELGLVPGTSTNNNNGNGGNGPPGLVSGRSMSRLPQDSKSSSLLTNPDMLLILLKQVWKEQEIYSNKLHQQNVLAKSPAKSKIDMKSRIYQKIRFRKEQQLSKVLEESDTETPSTVHVQADKKDTSLTESLNEIKESPPIVTIPKMEKIGEDNSSDNIQPSNNQDSKEYKLVASEEKEKDIIRPDDSKLISTATNILNNENNKPNDKLSSNITNTVIPSNNNNNNKDQNKDEMGKEDKVRAQYPLKHSGSSIEVFSFIDKIKLCFDLKNQSMVMRDIVNHPFYHNFSVGIVTFSALIELYSLQLANKNGGEKPIIADWIQVGLQVLFTIDLYCKVVAAYPGITSYFYNRWNQFDAALVIATWVPVWTIGMSGSIAQYIGLLRVLRILRLLKMLSWISELNIILHSIASSVRALIYVIILMFAFFWHCAVAGVFMFEKNDPLHFGTFYRAFLTLIQIASLDNWADVARTNMYGCDAYNGYDIDCDHPRGLGWIAAWYFVVVVIIGVMVLISLFVGIIITSMELLKEGIKEEKEVWSKVKVKQKQYNMRDATINNLLEIFDLIDIAENGKLTLNELKQVLNVVNISEANQFSLFMMVDTDSSGQIDFSEFLELIHLVGKAYSLNSVKKLKRNSLLPGELKTEITKYNDVKERPTSRNSKSKRKTTSKTNKKEQKIVEVPEEDNHPKDSKEYQLVDKKLTQPPESLSQSFTNTILGMRRRSTGTMIHEPKIHPGGNDGNGGNNQHDDKNNGNNIDNERQENQSKEHHIIPHSFTIGQHEKLLPETEINVVPVGMSLPPPNNNEHSQHLYPIHPINDEELSKHHKLKKKKVLSDESDDEIEGDNEYLQKVGSTELEGNDFLELLRKQNTIDHKNSLQSGSERTREDVNPELYGSNSNRLNDENYDSDMTSANGDRERDNETIDGEEADGETVEHNDDNVSVCSDISASFFRREMRGEAQPYELRQYQINGKEYLSSEDESNSPDYSLKTVTFPASMGQLFPSYQEMK